MDFTGERFIPGKTSLKVAQDHLARYAFAAQFVSGKQVLDIACGVGYGTKMLSYAGAATVDGIDISEAAVEYARCHYSKPNIAFRRGDICDYRSENGYDFIICFETIEHVEAYKGALRNLIGLLKQDGRLIVSSPNRIIMSPKCKRLTDRPSIYHFQEFTIPELTTAMTDCGLVVEKTVYGQRQQHYLPTRQLRWLYDRCFKPYRKFDPQVTAVVADWVPRYFVLIATPRRSPDPFGALID